MLAYPKARRRFALALLNGVVVLSMVVGTFLPALAAVRVVDPPVPPTVTQPYPEGFPMSDEDPTPATLQGLTLLLGEGAAAPSPASQPSLGLAQPLADESAAALLDRLPPLPSAGEGAAPFQLPPQSLPPLRAGETLTQTFPPPRAEAPPPAETGPLAVLRYAPEGAISIAPFVNVTFNQPMVPLDTVEALDAAAVPVRVTPALPGLWKWLGTRTLSFEYHAEELHRFPMATVYTVEVPAGTRSASGSVLAETVSWQFHTPPPTVLQTYPNTSPQPLDTLIFVAFDQRIDRAAVAATVTALAGGRAFPLRLATAEEVAAHPELHGYTQQVAADRWLALRATEPFPANTTVTVHVGPETPSAEGPLRTSAVQSFGFQTYAPLRVVEQNCNEARYSCYPGQSWYVRFNNPLDEEAVTNEWVQVEPAIPNLQVSASYDGLWLQGNSAGRTTYRVTLDGALADRFGQTLGEPVELTFYTGDVEAYLSGPDRAWVTLDPTAAHPVFPIYTINLPTVRLRAYAVTPEDWPAYLDYRNSYYGDPQQRPPGRLVLETKVDLDAPQDTLTESSLDLAPALGGKPGHLIVVVDTPPSLLDLLFRNRYEPVVQTWVQVTTLGVDLIHDATDLAAWVTDLRDGSPLAGVELTLWPTAQKATTSADGMARFTLPFSSAAQLMLARVGDEVAFLPSASDYWGGWGWQAVERQDELRWWVFDDRQMYRPGETVHLKGWLRTLGAGPTGDLRLDSMADPQVDYTVLDPQGNLLAQGSVALTELGGFDLAVAIAPNSNLGYASVQLTLRNAAQSFPYYHSFQIQEFRRPEFEVTARNESSGPYFLGEEAVVAVAAQYYAGGPLPGADTTWTVSAAETTYNPPNWPDFVFGKWAPWWWGGAGRAIGAADGRGVLYPESGYGGESVGYTARTDPTGSHYLRMTFVSAQQPQPYAVTAAAAVMDVNRQTWSAQSTLLVHPADRYVGLRGRSSFVEQGRPLEYDVIVTDVDGNVAAGHAVRLRSVRLAWVFKQGGWVQQEVDEARCDVVSADEPLPCSLPTGEGGEYRVTAEVRDGAERLNRTELTAWVSGGALLPSRDLTQQQVLLIPDQQRYVPGETARILVQAPFTEGSGLLTVARSGILYTENFSLDGGKATLEIPIEAAYLPTLQLQVDLNGSAPRLDDGGKPVDGAPPQPAYATGSLQLDISLRSRTLTVVATPDVLRVDPGAETGLTVQVSDDQGSPVQGAELAVVVVDEAVLALTGYTLADPLALFYGARSAETSSFYGRNSLLLANPAQLAPALGGAVADGGFAAPMATAARENFEAMPAAAPEMAAMPAMEEASNKQAVGPSIAVRSNFDPLALFAPAERTGPDGSLSLSYKLPDNLTRYRVMVVAATAQQFGVAESTVTARLPLMVRPSAPRFLNFGDRFEFPVVVQNQTDLPLTVDVVARASNLQLEASQGQRVEVPANDRVEVRFAAAAVAAGTASVQLAAVSGEYADAATAQLPVYTPATTEAFATYGVVDDGAVVQPIARPQDLFAQFGGLELSTSSTALATLTDAYLYLYAYPFECSEQLGARILSVAALRELLTAFQSADLPTDPEIDAAMQRDLERLRQMQNLDGGFPYWARGHDSIPYNSVFVTHALVVARNKDYAVAQPMLDGAIGYLRTVEQFFPEWYNARIRHAISSYALFVRALAGDYDYAKARALAAELPLADQSLEAQAWLWQVLASDPASSQEVAAIVRNLNNQVVESAAAANFVVSYDDQEYLLLHSNRRTDAVILDALIAQDAQSDLIVKVVAGLMEGRRNGRWSNTQENVFVLLAMDRYFNTYEAVDPDFVARLWLGEESVAEHTHQGRTTETQQTVVPMEWLLQQPETQELVIDKEGSGRLYYRLGLRYAPTDLDLDPLDRGFVVARTYEAVDDPADVVRDEEGTWQIAAGARVRVRLTLVAVNRRYHVALVDRLPAGLEILNPGLAVSEPVPADPSVGSRSWWWGPWYDHQNLRDAGAEAFTPLLWDGVYEYSYVARATTPGSYVVPPARAEEMYAPELFGRSASDRVVVQ